MYNFTRASGNIRPGRRWLREVLEVFGKNTAFALEHLAHASEAIIRGKMGMRDWHRREPYLVLGEATG